MTQPLSPPSGMPPPQRATGLLGGEIDLVEIARRTCAAYAREFPDERGRYGPAGDEWCRHDNQHLLNWAVLSLTESVDYEQELAWLARVLEARHFPLPRLARCLELLAQATRETVPDESQVAARVESGASYIASRESFSAD
jgi:hypothetical protein